METEYRFRAYDTNKNVMVYDGHLYYPEKLTKYELEQKVYPCTVTSHGILFTRKVPKEYEDDYVEVTKNGHRQTYYSSWEYEQLCSKDLIIMSSTGQKDNRGQYIFKGDIIKQVLSSIDDNGQSHKPDNKCYEVIFEDGCYFLSRPYKETRYVRDFASLSEFVGLDRFEIIGHIFDNSDLLQE